MTSFKELVIAWAEEKVRATPSYEEYDYRACKRVTVENTVHKVLAHTLARYWKYNTDNLSAWETACDWVLRGVKGYIEQTVDELVEAVETDILASFWDSRGDDYSEAGSYEEASPEEQFAAFLEAIEEKPAAVSEEDGEDEDDD